jgi:PAS domain-containing protein
VSTGAPWKRYDPSAGPREFRPGLDDAEVPRAYIGLDGHFAAINAEFCKLVSYPETDFLNAYWPPVVDVDHRESLRRLTRRMMAGELESAEVDTLYMSGNGELVRVVGTISAERDDSGHVVRLVLDASPRATVSG